MIKIAPHRLKLGFYGPKPRVFGIKKIFIIFLIQVDCNNKLSIDSNFGKNMIKIAPHRLKLGFYGPKPRVLGLKLFFQNFFDSS
jgi:hypothetical protein